MWLHCGTSGYDRVKENAKLWPCHRFVAICGDICVFSAVTRDWFSNSVHSICGGRKDFWLPCEFLYLSLSRDSLILAAINDSVRNDKWGT